MCFSFLYEKNVYAFTKGFWVDMPLVHTFICLHFISLVFPMNFLSFFSNKFFLQNVVVVVVVISQKYTESKNVIGFLFDVSLTLHRFTFGMNEQEDNLFICV